MSSDPVSDARGAALRDLGASPAVAEELLAYNANTFAPKAPPRPPFLPLGAEPHAETWQRYADAAGSGSAFAVLREHLVQFRFPVSEGVSQSDAYRAATRRGVVPAADAGDATLQLAEPGELRVEVHACAAGRVPIVSTPHRGDFVTLVQVLARRNEPVPVPDSMGAALVTGLTNWHRVSEHRERWAATLPSPPSEAEWAMELRRLASQPERVRDSVLLLSRGPYSGVPAAGLGVDPEDWEPLSYRIRREHECTHYFTRRVFGLARDNAYDELIADYAALAAVRGRYEVAWALAFFGLERWPEYRPGGRLENYRGTPPLSDAAFAILQPLVHAAVLNLGRFDASLAPRRSAAEIALEVLALAELTLEELAGPDAPQRLSQGLARLGQALEG